MNHVIEILKKKYSDELTKNSRLVNDEESFQPIYIYRNYKFSLELGRNNIISSIVQKELIAKLEMKYSHDILHWK